LLHETNNALLCWGARCFVAGPRVCCAAMRKILSRAILAALLAVVWVATGSVEDDKAARMEALVERYRELGYLRGSVLVAEHGKSIFEKGVGEANLVAHTPNTPRTKFGIASITKQFTAVLILQLVAEGRLRLDEKVSDVLPWYRKDTGARMTIEQLLHHSAGLPPDYDNAEFSATEAASRFYEPQAFAEKFCQQDLTSEPGAKWNYSNCGYDLLGLILERVAGQRFDELLRERLLDPIGMRDTGMDHNDLERLGGAAGYLRHAGPRYTPGPYLDRSHFFSAGAMYSTVEDLYRWCQALSEGGLVAKEIRQQLFEPRLNGWGYGWFVSKIPVGEPGAGETRAEMRGDLPGNFFAWMLLYPERGGMIIVLRNGYGSTEQLEQNLQAILFDANPKLPTRSAKDVVAMAWLAPAGWIGTHEVWSTILLAIAMAGIWRVVRQTKRGKSDGRKRAF